MIDWHYPAPASWFNGPPLTIVMYVVSCHFGLTKVTIKHMGMKKLKMPILYVGWVLAALNGVLIYVHLVEHDIHQSVLPF